MMNGDRVNGTYAELVLLTIYRMLISKSPTNANMWFFSTELFPADCTATN